MEIAIKGSVHRIKSFLDIATYVWQEMLVLSKITIINVLTQRGT